MKRYGNILASAAAVIMALSFSGCNKWLNVAPENEQSNSSFWTNKEEVQAVVMGAYQQLRSSMDQIVKWGEVRGDVVDLGPGYTSDADMLAVKSLEIKPDNSICAWRNIYNAILRCNAVIEYAPKVLEVDNTFTSESCDAFVAEVKALRALCYFYLVRTFNNVPYITNAYLDDSIKFEVASTEGSTILQYIIDDLKSCMSDLPVSYSVGSWENKGRVTVWAAYAMLADIYLWTADYESCIEMCNKIENSKLYSLVPKSEWYTIYYPGNSDESIFELQWDATLEQTNQLFNWFYNESSSNRYAISDSAIEKFNEYPGETDVRGAGGSYIAASSKIWKYAGTALGVDNLRESTARDANWIFYRYADVLLMHAEALAMQGTPEGFAGALEYVTMIRERAGYETHPDVPESVGSALDMVLDERLRELCFEGKRWFDLVRMAVRNDGEFKDKLISLLLLNVAAKDRPLYESRLQNINGYYLPVNETDIAASGGVLEQNPYYL